MKRFYSEVSVQAASGNWQVQLDGSGIKTQGGAQQIAPTQKLANLLADEWRAQGEEIDPAGLVFRDMADYAIDNIAADRAPTITTLLEFSETDTLCYRADPVDALFERQEQLWEPLVTQCEARHSVSFTRVSGIVHNPQKPKTAARLRTLLEGKDDFTLAGLQTLTALSASLIVGLAALEDGAEAKRLFEASNCEEDWQAELWGQDDQAKQVRELRLKAFVMAADFARAVRSS